MPLVQWTLLGRTVAIAVAIGFATATAPVQTRPTGSVSGRVTDAMTGGPVAFAFIEMRTGPTVRTAGTRYSARADESGQFRFTNMAAQTYFIAAYKPGYAVTYHKANGWTTLPPGERIGIVAGSSDTELELRLVPGGVITGRVTDQFGEAASGTELTIRRLPLNSVLETPFPFPVLGDYRIGPTGEFRLYGLPEGDYIVGATTHEQQFRVGSNSGPLGRFGKVFYPAATEMALAQPIAVRPGTETTGIDIRLGVVPLLTISGRVHGNAGESALLALWLQPSNDYKSAYVKSDGTFSSENLVPGRYFLTAQSGGGASPRQPPPAALWASMEVALSDKAVADVDVFLQPTLRAAGLIESERPLSNARVVFSRESRPWFSTGPHSADVGGDGRFVVADLIPGTYSVAVFDGVNERLPSTVTAAGKTLPDKIEVGNANITDLVIRIRKQ